MGSSLISGGVVAARCRTATRSPPRSPEPEGKIVQYYQYARFEYWPEGDEDGNYVTLGEIGRELGPPLLVRRFASRERRPRARS